MPEQPFDWSVKHAQAVAEVDAYFMSSGLSAKPLDKDVIKNFEGRDFASGWRVPVCFSDGQKRDILLLVRKMFPFVLPRASLTERSLYLKWPHVEEDGVLCLYPDGAALDNSQPVLMVRAVLKSACQLIEKCIDGSSIGDFGAEFHPYWGRCTSSQAKVFLSLLSPCGPSRIIKVWRGGNRVVVCDDVEEGQSWVQNYLNSRFKELPKFYEGVLLWLPEPLMPPYPDSSPKFLRMIKGSLGEKGEGLLAQVVKTSPSDVPIVIGFATDNGTALGALTTFKPKGKGAPGRKKAEPVLRGFRPGKAPNNLANLNFFSSGSQIIRHKVQRVDSAWLHGRGVDETANNIRDKTVAVVGVGAVGSAVATTLAKAGIGRLILIDGEKLDWSNVGRHVLGAQSVGQFKSKALSEYLRLNHPGLRFLYDEPTHIQDMLRERTGLLQQCDLIVSVTADWSADSTLNIAKQNELSDVPIVYGWAERFGVAGHAVALLDDGCFQCGHTRTGTILKPVLDWGATPVIYQEPACGTIFQPFGPTELGFINALIANLAVDILVGKLTISEHRVWIGPAEMIHHYGASFNADWCAENGVPGAEGQIVRINWPTQDECPSCKQGIDG